jgi:hypothetical protein
MAVFKYLNKIVQRSDHQHHHHDHSNGSSLSCSDKKQLLIATSSLSTCLGRLNETANRIGKAERRRKVVRLRKSCSSNEQLVGSFLNQMRNHNKNSYKKSNYASGGGGVLLEPLAESSKINTSLPSMCHDCSRDKCLVPNKRYCKCCGKEIRVKRRVSFVAVDCQKVRSFHLTSRVTTTTTTIMADKQHTFDQAKKLPAVDLNASRKKQQQLAVATAHLSRTRKACLMKKSKAMVNINQQPPAAPNHQTKGKRGLKCWK